MCYACRTGQHEQCIVKFPKDEQQNATRYCTCKCEKDVIVIILEDET